MTPWPPEAVIALRLAYGREPTIILAARFRRSPKAVRLRAFRSGVSTDRKFWTESEMNYLRMHYGKTHHEDIAAVLARTPYSVRYKARKLRLHGLKHGVSK